MSVLLSGPWLGSAVAGFLLPHLSPVVVVVSTYDDSVVVQTRQTLRLHGVMISYAGPDPTVNAVNPPQIKPAGPDRRQPPGHGGVDTEGHASRRAGRLLQRRHPGVEHAPDRRSNGPGRVFGAVDRPERRRRHRSHERRQSHRRHLLRAAADRHPIANVGGCESSGVSTGPNGQQVTMAHEVGHGTGLAHGPCGTPGDPNYPATTRSRSLAVSTTGWWRRRRGSTPSGSSATPRPGRAWPRPASPRSCSEAAMRSTTLTTRSPNSTHRRRWWAAITPRR